jgi:hypothetical protein
MVSLLDIADDVQKTVPIRGKDIPVHGLSANAIVALLKEFPELRALIAGRAMSLDMDQIMQLAPNVLAALIAAGTGHPGDQQMIKAAGNLATGEQFELIYAIADQTFPQGLNSFLEKLDALGVVRGKGDSDQHQKLNGPVPGMAQDMRLPELLNS